MGMRKLILNVESPYWSQLDKDVAYDLLQDTKRYPPSFHFYDFPEENVYMGVKGFGGDSLLNTSFEDNKKVTQENNRHLYKDPLEATRFFDTPEELENAIALLLDKEKYIMYNSDLDATKLKKKYIRDSKGEIVDVLPHGPTTEIAERAIKASPDRALVRDREYADIKHKVPSKFRQMADKERLRRYYERGYDSWSVPGEKDYRIIRRNEETDRWQKPETLRVPAGIGFYQNPPSLYLKKVRNYPQPTPEDIEKLKKLRVDLGGAPVIYRKRPTAKDIGIDDAQVFLEQDAQRQGQGKQPLEQIMTEGFDYDEWIKRGEPPSSNFNSVPPTHAIARELQLRALADAEVSDAMKAEGKLLHTLRNLKD